MNARMDHPAKILPGALDALLALGKAGASGGLPQKTTARAAAGQPDQRV